MENRSCSLPPCFSQRQWKMAGWFDCEHLRPLMVVEVEHFSGEARSRAEPAMLNHSSLHRLFVTTKKRLANGFPPVYGLINSEQWKRTEQSSPPIPTTCCSGETWVERVQYFDQCFSVKSTSILVGAVSPFTSLHTPCSWISGPIPACNAPRAVSNFRLAPS